MPSVTRSQNRFTRSDRSCFPMLIFLTIILFATRLPGNASRLRSRSSTPTFSADSSKDNHLQPSNCRLKTALLGYLPGRERYGSAWKEFELLDCDLGCRLRAFRIRKENDGNLIKPVNPWMTRDGKPEYLLDRRGLHRKVVRFSRHHRLLVKVERRLSNRGRVGKQDPNRNPAWDIVVVLDGHLNFPTTGQRDSGAKALTRFHEQWNEIGGANINCQRRPVDHVRSRPRAFARRPEIPVRPIETNHQRLGHSNCQ